MLKVFVLMDDHFHSHHFHSHHELKGFDGRVLPLPWLPHNGNLRRGRQLDGLQGHHHCCYNQLCFINYHQLQLQL